MTQTYFSKLNYSLGNEDTALELAILPEGANHVYSVAGSGGRVLPLLAKSPKRITCIDVAQEQLYLTELRFAAVRAFSHEEFLAFFGYPPSPASPKRREMLFQRVSLSPPAQKFFQNYFKANKWESLLYDGKWEKTFAKLAFVNRRLTGRKGANLFEAKTLEEELRYLEKKFPRLAWKLVVFLLGNANVFNALLYKGQFAKKNIPEGFVEFYLKCFERLFRQGPARENYFLELCFFGKLIHPEANPVECDPAVYAKAKEALKKTEVHFVKGDVIEEAAKATVPIDFYSLSDVPSYFAGVREKRFLQSLRSGLAKNAIVVLRHYLHVPDGKVTDGYEDITGRYRRQIEAEKVGVYKVEILRHVGNA